jgi:hypothetical protein
MQIPATMLCINTNNLIASATLVEQRGEVTSQLAQKLVELCATLEGTANLQII